MQPSVFKTNKKGESNTQSLAPDQVLGSSQYPRGGQMLWQGFYPSDRLASGAAREPSSSRQSPESSNPSCVFWQQTSKERSTHWNCHHEWLTSSCSRITLEHVTENKFYSPSCMMFWGILWGGRWDLWCIVAKSWCYCKSHKSLVLSYSPSSIQQCDYVKNELKF